MLTHIAEGFLLGLSLGTTCLVTCGPVLFAFILRQERSLKDSFIVLGEILLGRFFGYAIFGAAAGFIGGMIPDSVRIPISFTSFIVLGGILIYYGINGGKYSKKCPAHGAAKYASYPLLLGFLTGLSICPPFLLAIAHAVSIGGAIGGITLFIGFFFGTSLFMLPIAFFGTASSLKGFRIIAGIASVVVGVWFFAQGASGLVLQYATGRQNGNSSIVGVPDAKKIWIISDDSWGDSLAIMLSERTSAELNIFPAIAADSLAATADTTDIMLWLVPIEPPIVLSNRMGIISFDTIPNQQSLLQFVEFLNIYHFKKPKGEGFIFHWKK